jgi:hypothetical protein
MTCVINGRSTPVHASHELRQQRIRVRSSRSWNPFDEFHERHTSSVEAMVNILHLLEESHSVIGSSGIHRASRLSRELLAARTRRSLSRLLLHDLDEHLTSHVLVVPPFDVEGRPGRILAAVGKHHRLRICAARLASARAAMLPTMPMSAHCFRWLKDLTAREKCATFNDLTLQQANVPSLHSTLEPPRLARSLVRRR